LIALEIDAYATTGLRMVESTKLNPIIVVHAVSELYAALDIYGSDVVDEIELINAAWGAAKRAVVSNGIAIAELAEANVFYSRAGDVLEQKAPRRGAGARDIAKPEVLKKRSSVQ
jgi:hypothetical protein